MFNFPYQNCCFGPKACLKRDQNSDNSKYHSQDNLSQQLTWTNAPKNVLVIKKNSDNVINSFASIVIYLIRYKHLNVFIEANDFDSQLFNEHEEIAELKAILALKKLTDTECSGQIDLIICLGGDGTLLHATTLFQKSCPPVLSIHMGSLGFLCPFELDSFKEYISSVLKGNVPILIRSRLRCKFEKINDTEVNCLPSINEWLSLNEIVISRGQSSFLTNLDLYINNYLITSVQGDGLIISTPTGSTAYAMAAGASMCHPSVPSIIIAPICPHSLSFRPIVVPAGVELKIRLNSDARSNASFSVDGRVNHELAHEYQLSITTSEYPLPSICRNGQLNDWFEGLASVLNWNQRQKQLPLNPCYLNSNSPVRESASLEKINGNSNSKSDLTSNHIQSEQTSLEMKKRNKDDSVSSVD